MKLYNCPYKGDMCFLYGNCEECAFYKSMEKNRNYRKTIKNLKKSKVILSIFIGLIPILNTIILIMLLTNKIHILKFPLIN